MNPPSLHRRASIAPPPSTRHSVLLRFPTHLRLRHRTHYFSSSFLRIHRTAIFTDSKDVQAVNFDGPVMETEMAGETDDEDIAVVETCITRTLPPALTLNHGLQSLREAIEKLRLDPPSTHSNNGLLRFQVAVPPGAKALNWFCRQPESSQVFPLFFISKDDEQSYKSLLLKETRGVFGIGAAGYFTDSSSHNQSGHSSIKRYLANDSSLITTYGFMDVNLDTELCSIKYKAGSCYFFIPQVELDEMEEVSVLALTLVWNEASFYSFEDALASLDLSLQQASSSLPYTVERFGSSYLGSSLSKIKMTESSLVSQV